MESEGKFVEFAGIETSQSYGDIFVALLRYTLHIMSRLS